MRRVEKRQVTRIRGGVFGGAGVSDPIGDRRRD
jgi:hypothetical protein